MNPQRNCGKESVLRMIGEWRDVLIYEDGRRVDSGWRRNQVQNTNAVLLASLMKRRAGFDGILYLAVGSGSGTWDSGVAAQDPDQTQLTAEFFRKSVLLSQITFRDPDDGSNVDPTPTNVIQIDVVLDNAEANGTHREFGLFGGDATGAANSGLMVNWIIKPRLDKDISLSIERSVRFTFQQL